MNKAVKGALLAAGAAGTAALAADVVKNIAVKALPDRPASDEGSDLVQELLYLLDNPDEAAKKCTALDDEYILNALLPAKKYIEGRFDCMDFRMQSLMRIYCKHIDTVRELSPAGADMIRELFLGAKYWMNEPGSDSLCFWSENHQMLYAVSEYLAGKCFPDDRFFNDGATGLEHMKRGRERIRFWTEHRFRFGFSEFNSANYYMFNVGPCSNFIEFAAPEDRELVTRVKMCLDLLIYDIASNKHGSSFIAPTGRAYTDNMVGISGDRTGEFAGLIWGTDERWKTSRGSMLINFVSMLKARDGDGKPLYEIPPVLVSIGGDTGTHVTASSNGIDVCELKKLGMVGHDNNSIMMQLGMEAFTNPEVIYNTVTYFADNNMFKNSFVTDFRIVNLKLLKNRPTLGFISRRLKPMPNGIAIQRANLYGYHTKDYTLSCVQRYHPGDYGAQPMLSNVNFGKTAVFTTHPARHESEKTVTAVPGYWTGYGRSPDAAQYENVLMQIHRLPSHSGFLELYAVPDFTHTFLPDAFFDEVVTDGQYAFARVDGAHLAVIGATELMYKAFSPASAAAFKNGLADRPESHFDLIQHGHNQFTIYELSSAERESFEEFKARVKSNPILWDGGSSLTYETGGKTLRLEYKGAFRVNSCPVSCDYPRFASPYIKAPRDAKTLEFAFGGHTLTLDYTDCIRKYD